MTLILHAVYWSLCYLAVALPLAVFLGKCLEAVGARLTEPPAPPFLAGKESLRTSVRRGGPTAATEGDSGSVTLSGIADPGSASWCVRGAGAFPDPVHALNRDERAGSANGGTARVVGAPGSVLPWPIFGWPGDVA